MMRKLIQTKCPIFYVTLLVCAVTLHTGCNQQSYKSPDGYDLGKPEKMQLGKVLNEISGLYYDTDDNTLLAISDSKRKVFQINIKRQKLKDYTGNVVPPDKDIEDLVRIDSEIYMLSSRGIIYQVPLHGQDTTGTHAYQIPLEGKNDFETIYYDPSAKGLILLCKTCAHEKEEGIHNAYRFDLQTKAFDSTAYYTIRDKDVAAILKDDKVKFWPSAAAIHPLNKRLYILVSADQLLVIADTHGQVIEAYHLNPDQHPQAEGIAFAPNGDMYISNEAKYGNATLQIFRYKAAKNQ
jgi:uncharacterized protein YjiK